MEILIYLIPFTVVFSIIGLVALIWSIKSNQYEDLKGASERILFDDAEDKIKKKHDR